MLWTTDNNGLNAQASQNGKNQDTPNGASGGASGGKADESIEYLSTAAKINFSGTDFLTPGVKKAFIHLQKAFTKAPIQKGLHTPRKDFYQGSNS